MRSGPAGHSQHGKAVRRRRSACTRRTYGPLSTTLTLCPWPSARGRSHPAPEASGNILRTPRETFLSASVKEESAAGI